MPRHPPGWYQKALLILAVHGGGTVTTPGVRDRIDALGVLTEEELEPNDRESGRPKWWQALRNSQTPMRRKGELDPLHDGSKRWHITPVGTDRLIRLLMQEDADTKSLIQSWGLQPNEVLLAAQALQAQFEPEHSEAGPANPPVDASPDTSTADEPDKHTAPATDSAPPISPRTLDWLEAQTLWPRNQLEALIASIEGECPQLILAGPPGTGKTHVARCVAEYLVSQHPERRSRTVQFHPSYGYEEFMFGLRPVSQGGAITFEVTPGVVPQFIDEIGDRAGPHILLIDEINRANLPKVFGELMYLFEYRDEAIDLQYRRDFRLPKSLRFIGTMNTADRSIRSIDTALRRRFDIWECMPNRTILERYYALGTGRVNDVANLLSGFETLNAKLSKEPGLSRHHTIGHTFLMKDHMTRRILSQIWRQKIYPLIEEYFFDQPSAMEAFTFDDFWPST